MNELFKCPGLNPWATHLFRIAAFNMGLHSECREIAEHETKEVDGLYMYTGNWICPICGRRWRM